MGCTLGGEKEKEKREREEMQTQRQRQRRRLQRPRKHPPPTPLQSPCPSYPTDDHDDSSHHEGKDLREYIEMVPVLARGDGHDARDQQEGAQFLWNSGHGDKHRVEGDDGSEEVAESQHAIRHDAQLVHMAGVARVVKLKQQRGKLKYGRGVTLKQPRGKLKQGRKVKLE